MNGFVSYFNRHLARTNYDHAPLFLIAKNEAFIRKNVFCFENFLFDYEDCHHCVSNAWIKHNFVSWLLSFSNCVARTRVNIIKWKSAYFITIDGEINNIEQEISLTETADP